jgi:hypothetical protein
MGVQGGQGGLTVCGGYLRLARGGQEAFLNVAP